MLKKSYYIYGLMFVTVLWAVLSVWCFIKPADDFSQSERRPLEQFPETTLDSVLSGNFMTDFEAYSLDQFPFRDTFRTIKALFAFNIFNHKDNPKGWNGNIPF